MTSGLSSAVSDMLGWCRSDGRPNQIYDAAVQMFWKNVQARGVAERPAAVGQSPVVWIVPADVPAGVQQR